MSERVPLSFLLADGAHGDQEPVVPFAAMKNEDLCIVTAVLERTAICGSTTDQYERLAVRHELVLVDPESIEWRLKTSTYEGARLNGAAGEDPTRWRRRPTNSKSPWRAEMNITYDATIGVERGLARDKGDQRALKSQEHVKDEKEKELRLLRRRTSEMPAEQKEEEQVSDFQAGPFMKGIGFGDPVTGARDLAAGQDPMANPEKLKHCRRCGEDKPASQFPATGIYGGYCATCGPLEKAERQANRQGKPKPAKAAKKGTRRAPVTASLPAPEIVVHVATAQPDSHARVLKLLEKRDALRGQLNAVIAELREVVAAG